MPAATLKRSPKLQNKLKLKAPLKPNVSVKNAAPLIVPMAGESQSQFYLRAMRALQKQFPSINARTLEVLKLWRASPNDGDLRAKAEARFPESSFIHYGPRCIFLEHTVPASADGSRPEIVYNQKALQHLVDWANYRIANSDNFSAISEGHTPSQVERNAGAPMPDVLGYAGPFYLGQLGDIDPVWAIYADEWVHKGDEQRFQKLQRRSPEVWADEPMERRTLDPIAALGAETPRLDSGMNAYARAGDDRLVMRYSAAAGSVVAFPGPTNTFIPSDESRKQRYAGDSPMALDGENTDLADKIGTAIQALLPSIVNAVVEQLTGPEGAADDMDDANADADAQDTPAPRGMDQADANAGADAAAGAAPEPDGDEDPEAKKYKAMGPQVYAAYMAGCSKSMKYSRGANGGAVAGRRDSGLAVIVARQSEKLQKLTNEIARERRDVQRYSRLNELAREYAFDPREEAETCLDMTDAQFERHCDKTVTKYSKRGDVTDLDLYTDPEVEPDRYGRGAAGAARVNPAQIERYSREAAAVAARKNAAKRGSTTFEAEFEAICKQHGVAV